jgi:hypothetical protein
MATIEPRLIHLLNSSTPSPDDGERARRKAAKADADAAAGLRDASSSSLCGRPAAPTPPAFSRPYLASPSMSLSSPSSSSSLSSRAADFAILLPPMLSDGSASKWPTAMTMAHHGGHHHHDVHDVHHHHHHDDHSFAINPSMVHGVGGARPVHPDWRSIPTPPPPPLLPPHHAPPAAAPPAMTSMTDYFRQVLEPEDDVSDLAPNTLKRRSVGRDDYMQLPQPVKKQRAAALAPQPTVMPPIINGLHEPPHQSALLPPITSDLDPYEYGWPPHDMPMYGSCVLYGHGAQHSAASTTDVFAHHVHGPAAAAAAAHAAPAAPAREAAEHHLDHAAADAADAAAQPAILAVSAMMASPMSTTTAAAARPSPPPTHHPFRSPSDPLSSSSLMKPRRRPTKPRRKWSDQETNDLLLGVSKHGVGKWTVILDDVEFSFDGRSAGDLKDRFRTCCPEELRRSHTIKTHPDSVVQDRTRAMASAIDMVVGGPPSDACRTPASDMLLLAQSFSPPPAEASSPADAAMTAAGKLRKTRAHRKRLEDLAEMGITAPFKQSRRRERRAFTSREDRDILRGIGVYGPAWTKISRDPRYCLASRQPTDLRDRVRNKYPRVYSSIEKGAAADKPAVAAAIAAALALISASASPQAPSSVSSLPSSPSTAASSPATGLFAPKRGSLTLLPPPSSWEDVVSAPSTASPSSLRTCDFVEPAVHGEMDISSMLSGSSRRF